MSGPDVEPRAIKRLNETLINRIAAGEASRLRSSRNHPEEFDPTLDHTQTRLRP